MWLATTIGFFSITVSSDDATKMQIRARERQDLDTLITVMGLCAAIRETPAADYRYRVIIEPEALPRILATMAKLIDYTNFKHAVAENPDQCHKVPAYTRVWAIMKTLQPPDVGVSAEVTNWGPIGAEDLFPRDEFRPEPFSVPDLEKPAVARGGRKALDNPKARKQGERHKPLKTFLRECNQCQGPLGDATGPTCKTCLENF